jgi:hypothetical protein
LSNASSPTTWMSWLLSASPTGPESSGQNLTDSFRYQITTFKRSSSREQLLYAYLSPNFNTAWVVCLEDPKFRSLRRLEPLTQLQNSVWTIQYSSQFILCMWNTLSPPLGYPLFAFSLVLLPMIFRFLKFLAITRTPRSAPPPDDSQIQATWIPKRELCAFAWKAVQILIKPEWYMEAKPQIKYVAALPCLPAA